MLSKNKLRDGNALRKGERRLRRPEMRLIESLYPWVNPQGMHVAYLPVPVQPARGSPTTRGRRFP